VGQITLADVQAVLDARYPPGTAANWDAVGLVTGDPGQPVRHIRFAVDPVLRVAERAIADGVDLLVTHHPLLLRPVNAVPTSDPRGRVLHRLLRAGVGLLVAHTNADVARPGVSDALAAAIGLPTGPGLAALDPLSAPELDVLAVTVPVEHAPALREALAAAGAGAVGAYTRASFSASGTGRFQPGSSANPVIGSRGQLAEVAEERIEVVIGPGRRAGVLAAMHAAHPYEQIAFDVHRTLGPADGTGLGRIGELPAALPLSMLVETVVAGLPATAAGLRIAGDPDRLVRRVAVSGGAGDSLLSATAAAGADVFLTADLRHHPASGFRQPTSPPRQRPALIEATHWASEWPWLPAAARLLRADLGALPGPVAAGLPVIDVCDLVTDAWTATAGR